MDYYTLPTESGLQRTAQAQINGDPLVYTQMAIGDGNGSPVTPAESQSALVNERYRADLISLEQSPSDPSVYIATANIPKASGGWTQREIGLYDADGVLCFVGNLPAQYVPGPSDNGIISDSTVVMHVKVSGSATVTLLVDPSATLATRQYVQSFATPGNLLPGGTTGQVLRKVTNADGDTEWADPTAAINVTVDTVEEVQLLSSGQTVVDLLETTTRGLAIYINRERLPSTDWTAHPTINTQLTLATSYAAGTELIAVQNEPTGDAPAPLERSRNLSDLDSAATSRSNLGVYSKAEVDSRAPIGMIAHWPAATPPSGWMVRDGSAISRTAYAALFAVIGTTFGGGDGFTTFNLPDDRGGFDGNADMGRGLDPAMSIGAWLSSQNKSHSHMLPISDPVLWGGAVYGYASGQPAVEVEDFSNKVVSQYRELTSESGSSHARPNTRVYLPIIRAY